MPCARPPESSSCKPGSSCTCLLLLCSGVRRRFRCDARAAGVARRYLPITSGLLPDIDDEEIAAYIFALEGRIQIVTDAIGALDEPNLGIKVWPDFATTGYQLEPVGLKIEARTQVGLSGRKTWRSCLCRKTMHHQIPKEDQACICAGCLVEIVKGIS